MGGAADSLERPRRALEEEPRRAGRADSKLSRGGLGQTGSRAHLSVRHTASGNRPTHDLPFWANCHGPEHVALAIAVGSVAAALSQIPDRSQKAAVRRIRSIGEFTSACPSSLAPPCVLP